MTKVAIGIDIGGTFTKFGLINREGEALASGEIPTKGFPDLNAYLHRLKDAIDSCIADANNPDLEVVGAGIGAPNGNYYHGTIEYAPNLDWKGIVYFIKEFIKIYPIEMALTNDANAAAIGEMIYGGAKGMKNFVVITLGTGLGSGIVVNGELVYGHDGFAGEMGHITVVRNGRMCNTGRRGSLETYVSATGICRTVFELLADSIEESEFRDVPFNQLTAKMITDAANKGDKIALEAFEKTGRILGETLADTVAHLSPEAIFLFGGLANAGDLILKPTKEHMEANLLKIFRNKVKILPSEITKVNAAVLGASAMVWKDLV